MNIPHSTAKALTSDQPSAKRPWLVRGERWYRRGLLGFLAVLLLANIATAYWQSRDEGDRVLAAHTENLARLILLQAEHEARIWFLEDNHDGLRSLAHHLQGQEAILEVSVQDELGRSIVRAGHDLPIHHYLLSLPDSLWAVPMVATVMDHDGAGAQLLGFVRITFDYDRITAQSRPYHRASLQNQLVMLAMAFLAGILISFAILRRRRPIEVPVESDET
ncbi:hypothetical protein [Aliidiomarina indica]|uniref:hypothetical protein n=1 Tax=Aliidiomarina indica TaxID=2749147 RepID=UPI00188F7A60|nr:hypothetical protein [Aliidiomarina indica]